MSESTEQSQGAAGASAGTASFAELFGQAEKTIKEGEIAVGKVLSIDNDYIQIDIGFKSEGMIAAWEFMTEEGEITVSVGDDVEVLVEEVENEDGQLVLSKEKAERLKVWDEISDAYDNESPVEGTIVARVKGGLSVDIGVKAFLPGSQVDLRPVRNLEALLGAACTWQKFQDGEWRRVTDGAASERALVACCRIAEKASRYCATPRGHRTRYVLSSYHSESETLNHLLYLRKSEVGSAIQACRRLVQQLKVDGLPGEKLRGNQTSGALRCLRSCVCSMAWSFHAIDATLCS